MKAGDALRRVHRAAKDRHQRRGREDAIIVLCAQGIIGGILIMCAPLLLPVSAHPIDKAISAVGFVVSLCFLVRLVAQVLRVTGGGR